MVLDKLSANPVYIVAAVIFVIGLILVIVMPIQKKKYLKNHPSASSSDLSKYNIGLGFGIAMMVAAAGFGAFGMYRAVSPLKIRKNLASKLLSSKDPKSFDMMCNELFATADDPILYDQYQGMKSSRPASEVSNLCGNYAKQILGKK